MAVMALERCRKFIDHPFAHPSDNFRPRLRHERRQQETAERPCQAEAPRREGRRRQVERAVDINLLERVRAIAAVARHPLDRGGFHRGQDLPRELAAAGRVETERCARLDDRIDQPIHEIVGAAVDDIFGADALQNFDLRVAAHDVDERDAVLRANLDEHLAEVRRRGGVDDRAVVLHPHRLGKREAGQRIDEAGGTVGGVGAVGQRHYHLHRQAAIFGVHLAAKQRDGLAEQRLRFGRIPRRDDGAASFVADRECVTDTAAHRAHPGGRDIGGDDGQAVACRCARGRHVGAAEQQAKIRRVDRCGEDLHQHFVRLRHRHRTTLERYFELSFGLHERQHGEVGFRQVGHHASPVFGFSMKPK